MEDEVLLDGPKKIWVAAWVVACFALTRITTFLIRRILPISLKRTPHRVRIIKEHHASKKPVLELVEGIFSHPSDAYSRLNESQCLPSSSSYNSRDIPLQCLDARALMVHTNTSTPASSLDLEWEHEGLPSLAHEPSASSWAMLQEESESVRISDQSRVPSSADSLEWDHVQNSFNVSSPPMTEVDTDTQLLLSEIERLTTEALKETGKSLNS